MDGAESTRAVEDVGLGVGAHRVVYGERGGEELGLTVYRRRDHERGRRAPMVLDVHGGAWTHFDASVDRFGCRGLAAAGWVVAAADFTSASVAPWPAGLDDLRAAARWLRADAGSVGGDPARLAVIGGSTGGHYATMLGLLGDADGTLPDAVVALWPIVDVVGRYEMVRDARFDPITRLVGGWIGGPDGGGGAYSAGDRLAGLDRLWLRDRRLADLVGGALQRVNAVQARVPLARLLLYRELRRAHELAFPDGTDQMEAASAQSVLGTDRGRGRGTPLPPLLLVHAAEDANTTEAMSRRFVETWRAAGGAATLEVARRAGHSFGNIPSRRSSQLVGTISEFLTGAGLEP